MTQQTATPRKGTKAARIASETALWTRIGEIATDEETKTEAKANLARLAAESAGPRVWEPLAEGQLSKIAAIARPAESPCICGCGGKTKGRFVPGHDAVLKARLKATDTEQARQIEKKLGW